MRECLVNEISSCCALVYSPLVNGISSCCALVYNHRCRLPDLIICWFAPELLLQLLRGLLRRHRLERPIPGLFPRLLLYSSG